MTRKSQKNSKERGQGVATTSTVPPSKPNPIVRPSAALMSGDEEYFDFANLNVSDDEPDDDNHLARQSGHSTQKDISEAHPQNTTQTKLGVNDPSLPAPSSKGAADIHHFFEKFEGQTVCKLCRWVFMHSWHAASF